MRSKETGRVHVTYRANLKGGREVELRLSLDPRAATIGDAWRRLSAAYAEVEPTSLEIEMRPHRSGRKRPLVVVG
jgi:hypothetical protein